MKFLIAVWILVNILVILSPQLSPSVESGDPDSVKHCL